jgi:hypothetical protein
MKLRIKGDSLRYRLTQTDLKTFSESGSIEEAIHFGARVLTYSLTSTDKERLFVTFNEDTITLYFPRQWIREWVGTDRVGYDNRADPLGKNIYLLVEKDFTCLENVEEDQRDQFPNPLKTSL